MSDVNRTPKINPSILLVRKKEGRIKAEDELVGFMEGLYENTKDLDKHKFSEKNLVYFTLNNDYKFIDLFILCLQSLLNNSVNRNFDILIICPDVFRSKINDMINEKGISLDGINLNFFSVDYVNDGVISSMNKLMIYKWERIKEYGRVLFLDVDILFRRNVSELFDLELHAGILYAATHNLSQHLHNTVFHKVVNYSSNKLTEFRDRYIYAFNAGQYLFLNCELMLGHLLNVDLISREWGGEFFFEQSFMNLYFNWFLISDTLVLFDRVQFVPIHMGESVYKFLTKEKPVFLHFAGHACDAQQKIQFELRFI